MLRNTTYKIPSNITNKHRFIRNINEDDLLQWVEIANKAGQTHLMSQKAYKLAEKCLAVLLNEEQVKLPNESELSRLYINRIAKVTTEAIANQSNIKPKWAFLPTNKNNEKQVRDAELFNKKLNYWWAVQKLNRALVSVLQWAAPCGTGYIGLFPQRDLFGDGKWKIVPEVFAYDKVYVNQIRKDNEIDNAYSVTIIREMPLPQFHEEFPLYKDYDSIESGTPSWINLKGIAKKVYSIFEMKSWREDKSKKLDNPFPTVKVYYIFIRDTSINTTGYNILMGEIDDDFSYIVPSYYDEYGEVNQIETGKLEEIATDTNPTGKELSPVKRNVELNDCRLYPNRRLLICTKDKILYDGANKYWTCGHVPIAPFYFIKWVNEFLGLPFISSAISAQTELNRLLRALMDAVVGKISPPMGIDESVSDRFIKNFNPRAAIGTVIKYNLRVLKDAFKPLLPADFYNIDARAFELIKFLVESIDYILSSNDMSAALKLRQTPSADTQEALLESMGAIPTFINRGIEESLERLGEIWKGLEFQYCTTSETIKTFGSSELDYDTFDFDPNSIVPLTDESDRRPRWQRAREYMQNLSFYIVPNSLHEQQSITHKLESLQMKTVGIEISNETIFKQFRPNQDYTIEKQKYFNEQLEKLMFATKMQKQAQIESQPDLPPNPNILEAALHLLSGSSNNGKGGRPQTYQDSPQLEQKKTESGIPRVTQTSS